MKLFVATVAGRLLSIEERLGNEVNGTLPGIAQNVAQCVGIAQ